MPRSLNEYASVQGLITFVIIVAAFSLLWIMLSPMVDNFLNIGTALPGSTGVPMSYERIEAINTVKTVWWLLPFIVMLLAGAYYWKEAIKKRSAEV